MTESFAAPEPPSSESPDPAEGQPTGNTGSRTRLWIVAAVVILVAGAAGLWLGGRQRQADPGVADGTGTEDVATKATAQDEEDETAPEDVETAEAELYFAGDDGRLYAERRELPVGTPAERARELVAALLMGPESGSSSGLRSPLPAGSRVETVYLLGTTALLDLRPPEPKLNEDGSQPEGPPTAAEARLRKLSYGSKQELLAVYSLVNTVVLGVDGIDSVQILWDGRQPETFAGHVDTTRPLAADPSYLASR